MAMFPLFALFTAGSATPSIFSPRTAGGLSVGHRNAGVAATGQAEIESGHVAELAELQELIGIYRKVDYSTQELLQLTGMAILAGYGDWNSHSQDGASDDPYRSDAAWLRER